MKEAIQKAIEGGWKLRGYEEYPQEVEFFPAEKDGEKVIKWNPYWVKILITTTHRDNKPFKEIKQERVEMLLLDPLFWQALGKAMGWGESADMFARVYMPRWKHEWHRFIDHLAEGGDASSFFKELLK